MWASQFKFVANVVPKYLYCVTYPIAYYENLTVRSLREENFVLELWNHIAFVLFVIDMLKPLSIRQLNILSNWRIIKLNISVKSVPAQKNLQAEWISYPVNIEQPWAGLMVTPEQNLVEALRTPNFRSRYLLNIWAYYSKD